MNSTRSQLEKEILRLKAELAERESALPAHSVRPHQLLAIEALEDEIARKQEALSALDAAGKNTLTEGDCE
jgi:predicted transcriptional regulator